MHDSLRIGVVEDTTAMESTEKAKDWNFAKDNLYCFLVNKESNKEELEEYITEDFLDLTKLFYVRIVSDFCTANIEVTKEIFDSWEVTIDDLNDNVQIGDHTCRPLTAVLREMNPLYPAGDDAGPTILFLSNSEKYRGDAAMLDNELLSKVGGELNSNYYIIPCSIHELLVVPTSQHMDDLEDLRRMVCGVNAEFLMPHERLSDTVYHYDRVKAELTIAA